MKYIQRHIEEKIVRDSKGSPVVALLGPRQSGKTTLAKKLFSEYLYVNLEFPDVRLAAEKDPRGFLDQADKMIIDEIQRIPELFSYIQGIVDADTSKKFVVTGSSNFKLLSSLAQSLAGRVSLFTVLPFSKKELEDSGQDIGTLNQYIYNGGYPRIWTTEVTVTEWYKNYIQTYLEKDIRSIHNVVLIDRFFVFLRIIASRVGNVLKVDDIAKEVSVAPNTIKDWLSLLEESYIIFRLRPHYENTSKRLIKSPKIYFYDTGLAACLLGITTKDEVADERYRGKLFENMVILERIKNVPIENSRYSYYREYSGSEIDLLVQGLKSTELIEIKSSTVYKENDSDVLYKFMQDRKDTQFILKVIYAGELQFVDRNVSVESWKSL